MLLNRRIITTLLAGITGVALLTSGMASAANQTVGQALEIAPPVLNLKADPGETVKTTIKLRDVSPSPLVVRNQINDFVAAGEDGTPKILLGDEAGDSRYSLRDWIQPLPEFTLKSKEVNDLPLTINVPRSASPGGYFAVVRFTANPPGIDSSGVSLSASLGTLVLLRVNGDATESLKIKDFFAAEKLTFTSTQKDTAGWLFESAPIRFVTRLENSGNSIEQPVGRATIKDMFGNEVAGVNINLDGNNVLPGSTRRFDALLDKTVIGDRFLFGPYTADLTVKYGSKDQTLTESASFWVIPYRLIAFVIILLVIAFVLIRIALRRYTERAIARSRGRRRRR